jgi:hypothetical protein
VTDSGSIGLLVALNASRQGNQYDPARGTLSEKLEQEEHEVMKGMKRGNC